MACRLDSEMPCWKLVREKQVRWCSGHLGQALALVDVAQHGAHLLQLDGAGVVPVIHPAHGHCTVLYCTVLYCTRSRGGAAPEHPAQLLLPGPAHRHVYSHHELLQPQFPSDGGYQETGANLEINSAIIVIINNPEELVHEKLAVSVRVDFFLV